MSENAQNENKAGDSINDISNKFAPKNVEVQSKMMMIIFAWLLGWTGFHRYKMGYSNWWLMLITGGGCGIWSLYDLIMIIMDKMTMADGTPLKKD